MTTKIKIEIAPAVATLSSLMSQLMEECLNSTSFSTFCEARKFKFTTLTGRQVYALLMQGKESWNNEVDFEWDITKVRFESKNNGVVGHMTIGKEGITTNRYVVKKTSELAGNLAHEMCHHLGFKHPYLSGSRWTPWGHKYSGVCYDVGYFFRDFVAKKLKELNIKDSIDGLA